MFTILQYMKIKPSEGLHNFSKILENGELSSYVRPRLLSERLYSFWKWHFSLIYNIPYGYSGDMNSLMMILILLANSAYWRVPYVPFSSDWVATTVEWQRRWVESGGNLPYASSFQWWLTETLFIQLQQSMCKLSAQWSSLLHNKHS